MEEENEVLTSPRRHVKQSISVPFLWEEKPGTPKRDWPMTQPTPWITAPSPSRLIVSVPLHWEEEPEKPRPAANHFMQKDDTSSDNGSEYHDDWCSSLSETDGNGSPCHPATQRNDSISAASVTESFCPLPLPPSVGFLEKVIREADAKQIWSQKHGLGAKRTLTLGQLILLSRQLSYGRKTINMMKKKRFSMEFVKEFLPTCVPFKTTNRQNIALSTKLLTK